MMRFCTITLGCKVNQFETQAIESILILRGHTVVKPGEGCDVCIINTCTVTAESARKSRQAVRRAKGLEPDALIAVCGCLSQVEPSAAAALGADIIGGSGDRHGFALEAEDLFLRKQGAKQEKQGDGSTPQCNRTCRAEDSPSVRRSEAVQQPARLFEELVPGGSPGRTRALLKIQDGCDSFCTYCIIPHARGRSRSLPVVRATEHARRLNELGYREIVITGIEISSYGKDLSGTPALVDVVYEISAAAPHARLRLGSLDPGFVTERFCSELSAINNMCNHFHLSLQSGCDETLRRMGRRYDTNHVISVIGSLRRYFPGCGITADLITGFPGETDNEFEQTTTFIRRAAFSGMHIFPFSPRPGTPAAVMPEQVGKSIRKERARTATVIADEMELDFKQGQIGKAVEVLFERKRGGFWTGHSRNYIEVTAKSGGEPNSVQNVQISDVSDGFVWGEIRKL